MAEPNDKLASVSKIISASARKQMREYGGEQTIQILDAEKELRASGWEVELMDFSISDMTAYVDYSGKQIWVNISSSYYATAFFKRVSLVLNPDYDVSEVGLYKYEFVEGERIAYVTPPEPEHTHFYHLWLQVSKVDSIERTVNPGQSVLLEEN